MKKVDLGKIIPLIAGLVILVEGSFIFSFAGPASIEGIGGIMKSTVLLGGLQLLILGLIAFVCSVLLLFDRSKRIRETRFHSISRVVIILIGLIVIVEGVVLAFMGGKTTIDGLGTFEAYIVAGFAAQLFFTGIAILIPTILQEREIGMQKLLAYAGGAATASTGLVIIGVAADTVIQGIGGIMARTVELAGDQLFILGLAIVMLTFILDYTDKFVPLLSTLRYLVALVVVIEGLMLISAATPIDIQGIGGITSRTVFISGFGLTLIGLFTLFATGLRVQRISPRLRRTTVASVFMLTLLIPIAALTFGQVF